MPAPSSFADLDAAIAEVQVHRLPQETRDHYGKYFGAFEAWCEQHGLQALPASATTLVAFCEAAAEGTLRRPGKSRLTTGEPTPLAHSTLDVYFAAINERHRQQGFPPPCEHDLVQQARANFAAKTPGPASSEFRPVPMDATALERICHSLPDNREGGLARAAVVLLALDAGLSTQQLAAFCVKDVVPEGLRAGDDVWPVTCRCAGHGEMHWPWGPCGSCLLDAWHTQRAAAQAPAGFLFEGLPSRSSRRRTGDPVGRARDVHGLFTRVARRWPALEYADGRLTMRPGTPADVADGTRLGVTLAMLGQLQAFQVRATVLTGFHLARNFAATMALPLASLHRDPSGYRVTLADGVLRLGRASDCRVCATCVMDEFLMVRRAAGPGQGRLFCSVLQDGFDPGVSLGWTPWWLTFADIKQHAGISGKVTWGSLRRGHAALAYDRGHEIEQLRARLGHKKITTTEQCLDLRARQAAETASIMAGNPPVGSAPTYRPAAPAPPGAHHHGHHAECSRQLGTGMP